MGMGDEILETKFSIYIVFIGKKKCFGVENVQYKI